MKLLFFTVIPSPYQRQLFDHLSQLPGVDICVAYYKQFAHDREWKAPVYKDYEVLLDGITLSWLGPSAHYNPAAVKLIKSFNPDLVIVSDYSAPTAQIVMRHLASRDTPFVYWGETPGFNGNGYLRSRIRSLLQRPLSNAAALVGIGSRACRQYQELYPKAKTYNVPYFCDLAPFRSARERATPNDDRTIILYSGQLIHRKGVDVLLQAFNKVALEEPSVVLHLLGNGPGRDELEAMVDDSVRDRVHFLGHRSPSELPKIFAGADIFCLPSRHDGWGVVVNEALGAGLPIVASDKVGAAADLIEPGLNGFLFRSEDIDDLFTCLRTLVDGKTRSQFAEASSRLTEEWDVHSGAKRWKDAAEDILNQGGEHRR